MGRLEIADRDAETRHQGQLLLHSVAPVHLVVRPVASVSPGLLDQVPPVGCRIDQNILRLSLQPSLYDRLEVFVLDLELLKGQVIHIDDEPVIAVLDLGDDALQVLKLVLVDFDHPESLTVVAVQDCLNACGFAGSGISVEKNVVGHAPLHESFRVGDQLLLLKLVADQILQLHIAGSRDRDQEFLLLVLIIHAESLVETELAHTIFLVKTGDDVVHLLLGSLFTFSVFPGNSALDRLNPAAQLLHLLADASVEDPLRLPDRCVVFQDAETVYAQSALDRAEIIVKQFPEDPEIIERERIYAALIGPHLLRDQRKRRLCRSDQVGEIVVPQIFVKAVFRGQVQQAVHLLVDLSGQGFPVIVPFVELPADLSQTVKNALLSDSPVNDQFRCKTIHDPRSSS